LIIEDVAEYLARPHDEENIYDLMN
jgi:hypothetical protein